VEHFVRIGTTSYWITREDPIPGEDSEAPADTLTDFRTRGNSLSIYRTDGTQAQIEDIVVAVASGRQRPEAVPYIEFPAQVVTEAPVVLVEVEGTTRFPAVNQLHHDLVDLTARSLAQLVNAIWTNEQTQAEQMLEVHVRDRIAQAVRSRRLRLEELQPSMQKQIEPLVRSA
jgi:lipase chaperone LimK